MNTETGGLAEFAPAEAGLSAQPPAHSPAGADVPPGGSDAPGATQRRAARAVAAEAVKARAATAYTPPRRPAQVYASPGYVTPAAQPAGGPRVVDSRPAAEPAAVSDERREMARELLRLTLDEMRSFYARYVYLPGGPDGPAAVTLPLWAAHTFHRKRLPEGGQLGLLAARATPRLAAIGDPESGKSLVLELLRVTCANTFGLDHEPTASGMIDTINDDFATLLIDEGALLIGSGKRKAEVITALLGGYRPNGTKLRTRGGTSQRLSLFAPVALAVLPEAEKGKGENIRALFTRAIKFRMEPPPEGVTVGDFDADEDVCEAEGERYRTSLLAAMGDLATDISAARPAIPDGIRGRRAQIWRILLAIAEVAGGNWAEDARKACRALCLGHADRPPMPPGIALLDDLRRIWPGGAQVALTTELVRVLRRLDGAPWGGMWDAVSAPMGMAALLAPYDVTPVDVVLPDGRGTEGYRLACLEPAWAEHLADVDTDDDPADEEG